MESGGFCEVTKWLNKQTVPVSDKNKLLVDVTLRKFARKDHVKDTTVILKSASWGDQLDRTFRRMLASVTTSLNLWHTLRLDHQIDPK